MKTSLSILCLLLGAIVQLYAQSYRAKKPKAGPDVCAINLGGSYYINMEHIIMYRGEDVCDVKSRHDSIIVNLHLYDEHGNSLADIENNRIKGVNNKVTVKNSDSEFSIISTGSKQVLFLVKKAGYNEKLHRCELKLWVDAYMPNGYYLLCTPEKNSSLPEGMHFNGAVFENGGSAVTIN